MASRSLVCREVGAPPRAGASLGEHVWWGQSSCTRSSAWRGGGGGHTRAQLWECDDDKSKCKEVMALPGKPRAALEAGEIKEMGGTEAAAETVGLPQSVDSCRVRRLIQAETPKGPVPPMLHRRGCQARQTSGLP